MGLPGWLSGKESACQAGNAGSIPGSERPLGEGNGKPTPVLLPGKSHGQRSLVGYNQWGHKRVRHNLATTTTTSRIFIRIKICGTKRGKIVTLASYQKLPGKQEAWKTQSTMMKKLSQLQLLQK